ncbi:MAG: SH3 domain-containing protein [Desulfobacterales bacterium]|nr:SH3 domain-containing protein [Desulfobacterales bacterium]
MTLIKQKKILFIAAVLFFLFTGAAFAERLSIKVSIANVRSGPGSNYGVLWQVEKYFPILVVQRSGQWIKFKDFEGDTGWIHDSLVSDNATVISTKKVSNVRTGPGTDYDIAFTIEAGIPFKVLEKKGKWILIQHGDGDKGWIYDSLVW